MLSRAVEMLPRACSRHAGAAMACAMRSYATGAAPKITTHYTIHPRDKVWFDCLMSVSCARRRLSLKSHFALIIQESVILPVLVHVWLAISSWKGEC